MRTPTLLSSFSDVLCFPVLGYLCVEGGVIQGPPVFPAGGLDKSSQVGLRNVQARQPHHLRLTVGDLQPQTGMGSPWFSPYPARGEELG